MRWLADIVYLLAGLAYLPVALYQAVFLRKNRTGWRERFGRVPQFDPDRKRIWIHAVSLGEMNATPRLVSELLRWLPDYDIVFSTTTDTGYARAVELYGAESVFRFPLDFSWVIKRALNRIQPAAIILVELEVWYNLVHEAHRRQIPVMVVNGRLTARSARRLAKLGRFARSMFERIRWVGAQDEEIAERFKSLGVYDYRIKVTGSVKWDTTTIADEVPGATELARELGLDMSRPIWVCGSTGPGEEELLLNAYRMILKQWQGMPRAWEEAAVELPPLPILAIVPRKPERFDEVAALIKSNDLPLIRRSQSTRDGNFDATSPLVVLGDTMGELRKFYSLARVVFVGRSMVPMGGSDPMEVAALGKPIVCGLHMENFRAPVDALKKDEALYVVAGPTELAEKAGGLLKNQVLSADAGRKGREVVRRNLGATERTVERVMSIIDPGRYSGPAMACQRS